MSFDFNADPDPDPALHSDADPAEASQNNADPDPRTLQGLPKIMRIRIRNPATPTDKHIVVKMATVTWTGWMFLVSFCAKISGMMAWVSNA
jgi:hypothetical protein